ncbi:MAG: pyridine nucleotide-disulfide oxidoreductase, partial [Oscillibacter sp.]
AIASAFDVVDNIIVKARLVMGAVAPVPMRAYEAEKYLVGKKIDEVVAQNAAEIALKGSIPLHYNKYKIDMCKQMIVDSILHLKK